MPLTREHRRSQTRSTAIFLTLLLSLGPAVLSAGQPLDSLAVLPDSTSALRPGLEWSSAPDAIPARSYGFDLIDLLRSQPGSFLYDLGTYGWPHGWSPAGVAPHHVDLTWSGVRLNDLFNGRPRYSLIPLNSADPLAVGHAVHTSAVSVRLNTRQSFEQSGEPLTELDYRTSKAGLQKVFGLHTQNRRLQVAGSSGIVNVLFAYGGEASDGEYPGSRVRKGRQVFGRLKYLRDRWSLEVGVLHNRRTVGAHGGVIPRVAGDIETVYQRLGASVIDPDATRETKRSDLFASFLRDPGRRGRTLTEIAAGYSSQRSAYTRPGDTLAVRSRNLFARLSQEFAGTSYRIGAEVIGSSTGASPRSGSLDFADETDARVTATAFATTRYGGFHASARAGMETRQEGSLLIGSLALRQSAGPAVLKIQASQAAQPLSVLDRTGLGSFGRALSEAPIGANRTVRASMTLAGGPFDVTVLGSLLDNPVWIDYLGTEDPDSIVVHEGDASLRVASAGLDLGFRRHAERGIYLTAQPTVFGMMNVNTEPLSRYDASLPDLYAVAQIGARYLIFSGDLDLDVAIRARYWNDFVGRSLHTQTGLLVLPTSSATTVKASTALDLIVTAGVRTATFFIGYENFLAGTSALPGNLLVPVYPLADRLIRFGVFWPILN